MGRLRLKIVKQLGDQKLTSVWQLTAFACEAGMGKQGECRFYVITSLLGRTVRIVESIRRYGSSHCVDLGKGAV